MFIFSFPSGPILTNAYVVACKNTLQAVVIDPAPESAAAIVQLITQKKFTCVKILLTHSHWDHIADVKILKEHYRVPVYIHALDRPNLETPGSDQLPCPLVIQSMTPDFEMQDNEALTVGNLIFTVIHTPGHSPGSVCFYEKMHHNLFSGDTLFKGSMGKISFPTSRPDLMPFSLMRLSQLPLDTCVYPGHGEQTTIAREKEWLSNSDKG